MIEVSKDTVICISIAQYPSNFGTTLFNKAFQSLEMNYLYKACQVNPGMLEDAIKGIKALGIRGCGISMPFKTEAMQYADEIDPIALKIGAINTLVNTKRRLKGYNTDFYGVTGAFQKMTIQDKKIVLLGAGGMANAILCALSEQGSHDITIFNRSTEKAKEIAQKWSCTYLPWIQRNQVKADILINATPIGMVPLEDSMPINKKALDNFDIVIDVVVNPLESKLISLAKAKKKIVLSGYEMSLRQAAKQFELYTGIEAPLSVMEKSILSIK